MCNSTYICPDQQDIKIFYVGHLKENNNVNTKAIIQFLKPDLAHDMGDISQSTCTHTYQT